MRTIIYVASLLAALALIAGCGGQKHTVGGAGLGGIGGGVIGSQIGSGTGQTAAIIGGTLAGAALGGYVGSYLDRMDEMDEQKTGEALETNPDGETSQWDNPNTGISHEVTPNETYESDEGRYCRDFTTEADIGGEEETIYGTACRQPDGTWEIVQMD